jgi:GTPase
MKKIAIIGQPNVGKSSLFNRLLKERDAITSETAGTTRDVKRRLAMILDKQAQLQDTGGLDKGCELFDKISEKSTQAAEKADIILYMVDGKKLPDENDKKLFYKLQALKKDIALVVNKIDNDKMQEKLWEYYEFGTDAIFGISVAHNRGTSALMEWLYQRIPDEDKIIADEQTDEISPILEEVQEEHDENGFLADDDIEVQDDSVFGMNDMIKEFDPKDLDHIKIAIIGRVNVGKSSLLNALLNEDRSVVSPVAGTTIDPIDESIDYQGKTLTFVDTAGIRRRGKIEGIERFALMRTQNMLDEANMALIVLDASEPFLDLDEKIAGLVDKNFLASIIVLNKWDIADKEEHEKIIQEVRDRFKFLHYTPIITLSAKSHLRVNKLYDMILKINENYSKRIPTSKLNEVLERAMRRHQLPSMHGQIIKIYYATQYQTRPPRIALILNKPQGLHFTYRRYLTNKLREAFDFSGTPVLFKAKKRSSL